MTMFASAKSRAIHGRRNGILAGATFALALSASTAAMANCSGTGALGAGGVTPFLPFAGGGAVNSLISSINAANTAFLTQSSAFVSAPPNARPGQEGGGVWGRAIGGDIKTRTTSTTTNVMIGATPQAGTITCNNQTSLTFAGVQVGTDIATLNYGGGWNLHFGATAGYLGAKTRDTSSPGPLNPAGGTLTDQLQVPFAGLYAVATKGGLFIDGQIRTDYFQNSVNDPTVAGAFDQKLDARGLTFTSNIGYNHALQNNWFIEPSAGIVVSRVKVDPFNVTGAVTLPAAFTPNVTFPGTLRVNDINSTLGRLSLRGGTTLVSGNMIWQPFAIGSIYHEFENSVNSSFDSAPFNNTIAVVAPGFGAIPRLTGNVSSTTLGTYGQIGVGVSAQIVNTGWLGYIRGDYRNGDSIQGYSANGGIRYQFTPELIAAAPRYAKAPAMKAPMLVSAYNWTGFYVGGSAGVLNGRTDWTIIPINGNTSPRFAGGLGGIQAGYDHQFGKWVVGVEGAINATNAHGARACPPPADSVVTCETGVNWIGTATARAGYAGWDRSLWYVRGGVAFDESKILLSCNNGPFNLLGLPNCSQGQTQTRVGWTVGVGSEFALAQNWTVRSETNYFDMGDKRLTVPSGPIGAAVPVDVSEKGFITTVGLNYRFSPGVVVAKY